LGLVRLARAGTSLPLGGLKPPPRSGHRGSRTFSSAAPLRFCRRHSGERFETGRLELIRQAARSKQKPRTLVERRRIERLGDPLDDRIADRAALVGEDVAAEPRERTNRLPLPVEPILQVGRSRSAERALLRLAQVLRRAKQGPNLAGLTAG
jgi:hypothetical protein